MGLDRASTLLYAGEDVEERFELERATVLLTSHRLIALVPGAGEVRSVDRARVARVGERAGGDRGRLLRALAAGVVAVCVLWFAATAGFRALVPSPIDGEGPSVGIDDALGTVEALATLVDALALFLGLLAAAAALAFVLQYRRSRRRRLVLYVHGGEEVTIPISRSDPSIRSTLEATVGPGASTSGSKPSAR